MSPRPSEVGRGGAGAAAHHACDRPERVDLGLVDLPPGVRRGPPRIASQRTGASAGSAGQNGVLLSHGRLRSSIRGHAVGTSGPTASVCATICANSRMPQSASIGRPVAPAAAIGGGRRGGRRGGRNQCAPRRRDDRCGMTYAAAYRPHQECKHRPYESNSPRPRTKASEPAAPAARCGPQASH
jgi:hypothetical protein